MRKKWSLWLGLSLLFIFMLSATALAAEPSITIYNCVITGQEVTVVSVGPVAQSDDGVYYLFELKPYEEGIGSRTDYCAMAAAAETTQFNTPLNFNKADSKLYSRFVVAVKRGGAFMPVSQEMYITNPEAVAEKATSYPVKSKKGLTADWQYATQLKDLGVGYASYELDVSRFFTAGGINYTYNGKNFSFNAAVVAEYDAVCGLLSNTGANVVMIIKNTYNPATLDLILPAARAAGKNCYALNVNEQASVEKIEALLSFLANRYSGSAGTIHSWIIGNEVNNNSPWHYMGNIGAEAFAAQYAKEVRLCYNAIKSQNAGARVFISVDQRWTHTDSNKLAYQGRQIVDSFAKYISASGNIDWGLSIHPYPVPLYNAAFWNIPSPYAAMNLVTHADDSRMVSPANMDVVTNHMAQSFLLSPGGAVRHILISEMGFTSYNPQIPTDQNIQAAAMVYAYKLTASNPFIEGVIIHRQVDNASEIAGDGMAVGVMTNTGAPKVAYNVFKYMDTANTSYSDAMLPYIGAASWADLGVN